ncbi:hypothetical protein ACFWGD_07580 [Corynebacterium sp. NPDC060344]|uniref:hypothetical protein n=1 Tax=Corynebacterium sp. NPDC060344 TaxID=3347101 RepID=UPI00364BD8CA
MSESPSHDDAAGGNPGSASGDPVGYWIGCYCRGHRLPLAMAMAWGAAAVSALIGDTVLPIPLSLSGIAPPITVDAALALVVAAAVGIAVVTPLSYFEEASSPLWRIADALVIVVLVVPSIIVALASTGDGWIARNVAVNLTLAFPLAAVFGIGTAMVVLGSWMVLQCAVYGGVHGPVGIVFTVIIRETPGFVMPVMFLAAATMWWACGARIKRGALVAPSD